MRTVFERKIERRISWGTALLVVVTILMVIMILTGCQVTLTPVA